MAFHSLELLRLRFLSSAVFFGRPLGVRAGIEGEVTLLFPVGRVARGPRTIELHMPDARLVDGDDRKIGLAIRSSYGPPRSEERPVTVWAAIRAVSVAWESGNSPSSSRVTASSERSR